MGKRRGATANDVLRPGPAAIGVAIGAILLLYWALMTFVSVPGFGTGQLNQAGNLAAYIDRAIFTPQHMWPLGSVKWGGPVVYDPEGLLSSLLATANVLFGVLAVGLWLSKHRARILILLLAGCALVLSGLLLDGIFPINKKIWTSSFVLLTSGISLVALAELRLSIRLSVRGPVMVSCISIP